MNTKRSKNSKTLNSTKNYKNIFHKFSPLLDIITQVGTFAAIDPTSFHPPEEFVLEEEVVEEEEEEERELEVGRRRKLQDVYDIHEELGRYLLRSFFEWSVATGHTVTPWVSWVRVCVFDAKLTLKFQ